MKQRRPREPNPPHVKRFLSVCPACGRRYEGNFPIWVQIGPFPCICGATAPAPLVLEDSGEDAHRPLD
jgi:hypothetical protein